MLVEIAGKIDKPASTSRRDPVDCAVSQPTVVHLLACSSSMSLVASCGTGDNPRFFTVELFAGTYFISGYEFLTGHRVIYQTPRALIDSFQIALVLGAALVRQRVA